MTTASAATEAIRLLRVRIETSGADFDFGYTAISGSVSALRCPFLAWFVGCTTD